MNEGIAHERLAGVQTGIDQFPPLQQLPSWTRVSRLDQPRLLRQPGRDKVATVTLKVNSGHQRSSAAGAGGSTTDSSFVDDATISNAAEMARIKHLEKSIKFLQAQQSEVLASLHEELFQLKTENQALQLKLVLALRNTPVDESKTSKSVSFQAEAAVISGHAQQESLKAVKALPDIPSERDSDKIEEVRMILYEQEIEELRQQLKQAQTRNVYLQKLLNQAKANRPKTPVPSTHADEKGAFRLLSASGPRTPTLTECEAIIRHLQRVNEQQQQEVERLKNDIREAIYKQRWQPADQNQITKGFIPAPPPPRRLQDDALLQRETFHLPALAPTIGMKAADRRKRTQHVSRIREIKKAF